MKAGIDKKDSKDKKDSGKTALEAAYAFLANRMRTSSEMRKHLEGRGYDDEEITDAVNELIGMRYLDDYAYALRYYEYNREKRRGVLRAERELIEKGVDRETAQFAKEDFLHEQEADEYADALDIARRELAAGTAPKRLSGDTEAGEGTSALTDRLASKIARKLESKGYSRSDIFRVLDAIRREASGN